MLDKRGHLHKAMIRLTVRPDGGPEHKHPACEAAWRPRLVDSSGREDARQPNSQDGCAPYRFNEMDCANSFQGA